MSYFERKNDFVLSYDAVNETNIPVNVNISLALKDLLKIEEINHVFTLKASREKHFIR